MAQNGGPKRNRANNNEKDSHLLDAPLQNLGNLTLVPRNSEQTNTADTKPVKADAPGSTQPSTSRGTKMSYHNAMYALMMEEPAKQPAQKNRSPLIKPKGMFSSENDANRMSKTDMPTPRNRTPSRPKNMFTIESGANRMSNIPTPVSKTPTPMSNTPTPKVASPPSMPKMLITKNESSPATKPTTPATDKDMKDPVVRTVRVLKLLETRASNIANRLSEQPELQQELHMLSRDISVVGGFLAMETKGA